MMMRRRRKKKKMMLKKKAKEEKKSRGYIQAFKFRPDPARFKLSPVHLKLRSTKWLKWRGGRMRGEARRGSIARNRVESISNLLESSDKKAAGVSSQSGNRPAALTVFFLF
jgi:hypothetical protein